MRKAYTSEDPTNSQLRLSLNDYREQVEEAMLDEEVALYDRLQSVIASQLVWKGNYHEVTPIKTMLKAASDTPIMAMEAVHRDHLGWMRVGRYVVGYLDPVQPWSIVKDKEQGLSIAAHFADGRIIHHTHVYEHSSYGQSSTRQETAPEVQALETRPVCLKTTGPSGHENFARRIHTIDQSLSIGVTAIHQTLENPTSLGETSPAQRLALHTAATRALMELK